MAEYIDLRSLKKKEKKKRRQRKLYLIITGVDDQDVTFFMGF